MRLPKQTQAKQPTGSNTPKEKPHALCFSKTTPICVINDTTNPFLECFNA